MGLGSCLACALVIAASPAAQPRRVPWNDLTPFHERLQAAGLDAASFDAYVQRTHSENRRRVREGDLDHLIFYLLQSTMFTSLPPIEPALSAKSLVESLDPVERDTFLRNAIAPDARISPSVRARVTAFLRAFDSPSRDVRLAYFRQLVLANFDEARQREVALLREYLRAMRFVYQKEFVAQRSDHSLTAVAELYRTRGLSTDTAIEAGYLVYMGLGVLKGLEPQRRIRRVLIVGPGLDLAPRTALVEEGPPESYQPWAVIDALIALGLARLDDLTVIGADINPRVVDRLRRSREEPPVLTLVSGIRESDTTKLSQEYREYFSQLGRAIGGQGASAEASGAQKTGGHLRKTVRVSAAAARVLSAEALDIVTERLDAPSFDLVIATNILPYFDDTQLTLAMSNIAAMLAPSGVFLHNEGRSVLGDLTAALGVDFEQSRHATIATVKGAPPLFDSVFIHKKRR